MATQWKRGGKKVSLAQFQKGQSRLAELIAANGKARPQAIRRGKPLESVGLSVHRTQATEFNKYYRDNGITGVHHKPNGDCVIESREQRNKVLALRGLRDQDAGYGDFAGNN